MPLRSTACWQQKSLSKSLMDSSCLLHTMLPSPSPQWVTQTLTADRMLLRPLLPVMLTTQMFVLNGSSYDQHFLGTARTSSLSPAAAAAPGANPDAAAALNRDLDGCALLSNNKGKPLLTSLTSCKADSSGRLLLQFVVRGSCERDPCILIVCGSGGSGNALCV